MKGEIERIKEKKIEKDGTVYYLVKYHGYNDKRNTWEPYTKLRDMNLTVNKLIETFEEQLNNKFKLNSNRMLGGLTTITKVDESDIPTYRSHKKKLYFPNDNNKFKGYSNQNLNNGISNGMFTNEIMNNNSINSSSLFHPKEITEIRYDPENNKPILKVKWISTEQGNKEEKETEENYINFKIKYPNLLLSFLETKVNINTNSHCIENSDFNINPNSNNNEYKSIYELINI